MNEDILGQALGLLAAQESRLTAEMEKKRTAILEYAASCQKPHDVARAIEQFDATAVTDGARLNSIARQRALLAQIVSTSSEGA